MNKDRSIDVVGAATNNLQDVSVTIPANAVTAVVGVSGSGKSSLVDGTIAAVAVERTRRFLGIRGTAGAVDVPAFVGATPPLVAVAQRSFQATTRNTVATSSALLRVLRRIFVGFSSPFSSKIGEHVPEPTPEIIAQWLTEHMTGKAIVWAVPVYQSRTDGVSAVKTLADSGIVEAVVYSETDKGKKAETGTSVSTAQFKGLRVDVKHTIEAKVGEVRIGKAGAQSLLRLLQTAWRAGGGAVFVEMPDSEDPALARAFSHGLDSRRHLVHPKVAEVFRVADAHLFSFNAPRHEDSGACRVCNGLGVATDVQQGLLVGQPERSMHEGAFALWTEKNYRYVNIQHATIEGLRGREGFDPDIPWKRLPQSAKNLILNGSTEAVVDVDPKSGKKASGPHTFDGFRMAILERIGRHSSSATALKRFVSVGDCPACAGSRWRFETRALRVGGFSIDEALAAPFSELAQLAPKWREAAQEEGGGRGDGQELGALIDTVGHIAQSFTNIGLGHLSGNRSLLNVSDGESRRIKLASVLNSRLAGLLLVLDEPGRGLHEADLAHLAQAIGDAARSHTVLMSEHRMRLVQHAQHVIQLGPGSGVGGGRVVAPDLAGVPRKLRSGPSDIISNGKATFLEIVGASANTVREQDVRIPLGTFTCIAGVSGSGKSSFVRGVLVPALREQLPESAVDTSDFRVLGGRWKACHGSKHVKALIALDQITPPGQSRSLVGTYLGLAEHLRREFASTEQARSLGLAATDFGTNSGRGRCQSCLGLGVATDGGPCSTCGGLRFEYDALSVRVAGLNMSEWLELTLADLRGLSFPWLSSDLVHSLIELGIGHLSLGRSLGTLSGGEVQRLRLSRAITVDGSAGAVFILDEPACGLHPLDVERLYRALRHLVSNGKNTVVAVEHDPMLLAECDYLVEFGPGGGPEGGFVVSQGTPDEIRAGDTATGWALKNPSGTKLKAAAHRNIDVGAPQSLSEALAARQEIRQILGDDIAPPDEGRTSQLGAIFERVDTQSRPLELGGLEHSLVSIVLDMLRRPVSMLEELLRVWEQNPDASLHVNPLLEAVSVWGRTIPASVIERARLEAKAMGLDDFREDVNGPLGLRVSGKRLRVSGTVASERMVALRDAWALGSGFVDLIDASGKSLASATARLIDFEQGLAGPRRHRTEHFVRSSALGCCPMCKGRGTVLGLKEKTVIGNPRATVFDDDFLAPELAAKLKGFRRAILTPFFRRMQEEGMWSNVGWSKMSDEQKQTVLWGYWIRPGLGTFLKRGKDIDGTEVNHWLSWDGLVGELVSSRGTDESRRSVEAEQRSCPKCDGTGLSAYSRLLSVAGRSIYHWTRDGRACEIFGALKKLRALGPRQERELQRVLHCISPIEKFECHLNEPADADLRSQILPLIAKEFTGLTSFFN